MPIGKLQLSDKNNSCNGQLSLFGGAIDMRAEPLYSGRRVTDALVAVPPNRAIVHSVGPTASRLVFVPVFPISPRHYRQFELLRRHVLHGYFV